MSEITNETGVGTYAGVCGEAYAEPQATAAYADTGEYAEIYLAEADTGENPKVNMATGRLTYVQPGVAIGGGNYEINVAHIYSSHPNGKLSPYIKGMGDGWKLNVQQFLIKEGDKFKYADAAGEIHTFILFDSARKRYYDTVNAGNVLTVSADGSSVIADGVGNKLYFNAAGYIIKEESCHNAKIAKEYLYDAGNRIVEIYDQRNAVGGVIRNRIGLEYDLTTGLLSQVSAYDRFSHKASAVAYRYAGGKLTQVEQVVLKANSNTEPYCKKTLTKFEYDAAGKLTKVTDEESRSAIGISYDGDKVAKIDYGVIADGGLSCGAEDGAACALRGSSGVRAGMTVAPRFVSKSQSEYEYVKNAQYGHTAEARITNEKGITLSYFLDGRARIVSSFEKVGNDYRTLFKEGHTVPIGGSSATKINGRPYLELANTSDYTKYSPENFNLARSKAERKDKYFDCSFWLMHGENSERLKVKANFIFNLNGNYISVTKEVWINGYAGGAWQRVTVPFKIPEPTGDVSYTADCLRSITISLLYANNGRAGAFRLGDFAYKPAPDTRFILRDGNATNEIDFAKAEGISVVRAGFSAISSNNQTSTEVYFSESDVIKSMTDKFSQPYTSGSTPCFDVVCNDGTKRISDVTSFQFSSGLKHWNMYTLSWPFMTHIITPDTKAKTIQYLHYTDSGIELQTEVERYPDGIGGEAGYDGYSQTLSLTDYKGKKIYEKDEYGLKTEFTYDDYGKLVRTRVINGDTQGEISEVHYDDYGEYVVTANSGSESADSVRSQTTGNVTETYENTFQEGLNVFSRSRHKTGYDYDACGGRVTRVTEYDGADAKAKNIVTYENGRIRTVSDGNVKYGVRHDFVNDVMTYTQFSSADSCDETVLQKDSITARKIGGKYAGKSYTSEYFNTGSGSSTITTNTDKYDRIENVTAGGALAGYVYKTVNAPESSFAQPLIEKTDYAEQRKTNYDFDPDGNVVGWSKKANAGGAKFMSVRQVYAGVTKYSFGESEDFFAQVEYDPKTSVSPRVVSTGLLYDANAGYDDPQEISWYKRSYSYDSLGRVVKKQRTDQDRHEYRYGLAASPNTVTGYEYIEDIWYDIYKTCRINFKVDYGFDNRGNITRETEYCKATTSFMMAETIRVPEYKNDKTYAYDSLNRLIGETNPGMNISRTYSYGSDGRLHSINGTNAKVCGYDDKGRLISMGSATYGYNAYGHRIRKTNGTGTTVYSYSRGDFLTGVGSARYAYNADGARYRKTANGTTTDFYLDGDKIMGEDRVTGGSTEKLRYIYDADGLCGLVYNNKIYTYVRDASGNIVMILGQGKDMAEIVQIVLARYEYDAWGNCTVHTYDNNNIGNINPFRWRSHYYDSESGLYYANGSYYDPETGLYLDASPVSSVIENAYNPRSLDRNGLMCDNVLELLPYMYAVYSATELSPDPDYDVEEGQPWYVQAWNGFKKALADLFQAYEELHWGIKVLIGLALIAAAVLLTIVTYGGFTAAVPALINMALQLGIGIAGGIVMWGVGALLTNSFSLEGLRDALVDGIFWGGVFAFISASVNAVKEAVRAIKVGRIKRRLKNAANEYMKLQQALAPDAKALKDLQFVTATYDSVTKTYQYGVNGGLLESGKEINKQLLKMNPRITCAETQAISNALDAGSQLKNLYVYTIKPNGFPGYACLECSRILYNNVAAIFSGLHKNFIP